MKLSLVERRILANQYAILAKLEPDNAKSHNLNQIILDEGFEYDYNRIIPIPDEVFTVDDCLFVINVLNMYSAIYISYNLLPDKTEINEYKIRFPGFDGNNEKEYAYCKFALLEMKLNTELSENRDDFNSHHATKKHYINMLAVFDTIDVGNRYKMTKEELLKVINL